MRKIIALAIVIALAVAGYQVYGDENKKAMLKEKVNEVIYDAENSLYYIILYQRIRKDLQPEAEQLVKNFPNKTLKIVLLDGQEIDFSLKKVIVAEVIVDNLLGEKGDLNLFGKHKIYTTHNVDKELLNKCSNENFLIDKVYFKNNKLVFSAPPLISPKANDLTSYPTVTSSGILYLILSNELMKYTDTNSKSYLQAINSDLLTEETRIEPLFIQIYTENIFNGNPIYVKSYFQYKNGKFYEIKRESNVKEYIEWAKKNL